MLGPRAANRQRSLFLAARPAPGVIRLDLTSVEEPRDFRWRVADKTERQLGVLSFGDEHVVEVVEKFWNAFSLPLF